jgi:thiol reductant ABC exporter CydC subunit
MATIIEPDPTAGDAVGAEASLRTTLELARPAMWRLTWASLLGAAAVGAGIGLMATSAWLISRASQRPPEPTLALAIVAVQFFGLSRGLFRYAHRLVTHDVAFRALADLRVRSYAQLEALAPAGSPAFAGGDLLARVVHDIDSLQDLLVRVIPPFVIALVVGGATVLLMWVILPAAGLIVAAALVLAATALTWLTGRLARQAESRQVAVRGELTAAIVDLLRGAPELTAFGAIDAQLERAEALDAELRTAAAAAARTAGVGQGSATLLSGLAMWGAVVVGIAAVRSGRLDGVLLAVIALVPLAAFELLSDIPTAAQTLRRVRRAAARTFAILDTPPPVTEPATPATIQGGPHTLSVAQLRARYNDDGPWVLDGLDLDLAPGRKIAVVGRSGAGKSTLADVLLRFVPYQCGSVTLNGVEITDLDGDRLRRVVGLVAQDSHLFDTTLEENLRLAQREASDSDLREALRRASLLPWVDGLPHGLATRVGPNGASMSGGQRQRLAVARALLAGFEILVADEPGEHLDITTADALVADLVATAGDRALLLITHRLAGLEAVDEVLVLEEGTVVERGTHAELLAAAGRYASMWIREAGPIQPTGA